MLQILQAAINMVRKLKMRRPNKSAKKYINNHFYFYNYQENLNGLSLMKFRTRKPVSFDNTLVTRFMIFVTIIAQKSHTKIRCKLYTYRRHAEVYMLM
ncbi:hypothetical protein DNH61_03710 [Paenibacillus sambharensis]|uniref:Uncharacterized protein n=1 Tax=Paenibacillus sambharensis TaxID=1803190 RepID=A0A2W1LDM2_9BACL|nr:hypothetical protein DNH61_03710 [Paenibacillus sambharensis]